MSHPDPSYDYDNSNEDDMNYDDYNDFHEFMDDEGWNDGTDDSMDGDHESGLASAGWGTDEDYGSYNDHDDYDSYSDDF